MDILTILLALLKLIVVILVLILIIICIIIFSNIKLKVMLNKNDKIIYYVKVSYILGLVVYILDSEKNINCAKIFGIDIKKYKKLNKRKKSKNIEIDKEITKKEKENVNIDDNTTISKDNKQVLESTIKSTIKKGNKKNINKKNKSNKKKFNLKKLIVKIKIIINYPNKKEIINLIFLLLRRLIKAIKIKKIKINIDYGLDEPFKTGHIYGIISSIIPFLPKKHIKYIRIIPNFEEKIFLTDSEIKCSTSLFKILLPIIMFISKKPIKEIIFKKEK